VFLFKIYKSVVVARKDEAKNAGTETISQKYDRLAYTWLR
jgi:hypothetical protein